MDAVVTQDLPAIDSLNTSLYMVYAGFQDYFFPLYDQTITPRHAVRMVPSVVDAIISAVEVRNCVKKTSGYHFLVQTG